MKIEEITNFTRILIKACIKRFKRYIAYKTFKTQKTCFNCKYRSNFYGEVFKHNCQFKNSVFDMGSCRLWKQRRQEQ